jgi:hypothetical protein
LGIVGRSRDFAAEDPKQKGAELARGVRLDDLSDSSVVGCRVNGHQHLVVQFC